jgi:hypothetical protein
MITIYKYEVPMVEDFTLELPVGAQFLDAQVQNGAVQLWARVNTDAPMRIYRFGVHGTGHEMTEFTRSAPYIATFQLFAGGLVFHLFGGLYA